MNTSMNSIINIPEPIIAKMIEHQVTQGNFPNRDIFCKICTSIRSNGGFNWDDAPEGKEFWNEILVGNNFDVFFARYPQQGCTNTAEQTEDLTLGNIPRAVVLRMLDHQVKQGSPRDINVFRRQLTAGKDSKGFDWDLTGEDEEIAWHEALNRNNHAPILAIIAAEEAAKTAQPKQGALKRFRYTMPAFREAVQRLLPMFTTLEFPNEFQGNSIVADRLRELKVLDLWCEVVPEKPKELTATVGYIKGSGEPNTLMISITKEGFRLKGESATLAGPQAKAFLSKLGIQESVFSTSGEVPYRVQIKRISIGCKHDVSVADLRALIPLWDSLQ